MVFANSPSSDEPATTSFSTFRALTAAVCRLALTALLMAGAGGAVAADDPLAVSAIRMGVHPDSTRFVIETSSEAAAHIFGLVDPYRLVVDLPEAEFGLASDMTNAGAGVIENIRYGLFRPGTSRIVLDLRGPAKVARRFAMAPQDGTPWRLVIDLESTDRGDFVASLAHGPEVAPTPTEAPPLDTAADDPSAAPVIVIDAGHGGVDPGAIGPGGEHEKAIVLRYARALRDALVETGRYQVVMTRDRDIFLSLRDRVAAARAARGDLFISMHTNSHNSATVHGFSVYTLSATASDEQAARIAERENKADIIGGLDLAPYSDDVANILIDFARTRTNEESVAFARDVLVAEVGRSVTLLNRPWRSAGFAVLQAPDVPSVLVELGYLTNPGEARALLDPAYRGRLVEALVRAIDDHFGLATRARL